MIGRVFNLRRGEAMRARLLAVVRNHHDIMPGGDRDRPGLDRLRIETGGDECVIDVWSSGTQDIAAAPGALEIFDHDGVLRWRAGLTPSDSPPAANDHYGSAPWQRRRAG